MDIFRSGQKYSQWKSKIPPKEKVFSQIFIFSQTISSDYNLSLLPSLSLSSYKLLYFFSQAKTHNLFIKPAWCFLCKQWILDMENLTWFKSDVDFIGPNIYIFLDLLYSSNTPNTLFPQKLLLIFFIHYQTKEKYPFWGWRERRKANYPP